MTVTSSLRLCEAGHTFCRSTVSCDVMWAGPTQKRSVHLKQETQSRTVVWRPHTSGHMLYLTRSCVCVCLSIRETSEDADSLGDASSQPDTVSIASRTSQNTADSDKVTHTYTHTHTHTHTGVCPTLMTSSLAAAGCVCVCVCV